MPSVPRLDGPQVQERGVQTARQAAEAPNDFGNQQALHRIGSAAEELVSQAKNHADQLAVLDADKQMSAYETQLLYDPKTGAYNKRGKDSFGIPDQVKDDYKKKVDEISANLNNPVQRDAFARSAQSRYQDVDRQIQKHVSVQMQQFDDETTNSFIANERSAAALNYQDPERVNASIQRQQAALIDHAQRNGLPDEWVKAKVQDAQSKTNVEVVSRMLANGDDLTAKKYYDTNKERFTGEDAIKLEKDLEEGSVRGESQRLSDKIFASHGSSLTAAMEEVKKIDNPKIRDAAQERIKSNFAIQETADRERRTKLQTKATNIIDKTGRLDDIPPNEWNQFELSERSALKAYAKAKNEGAEIQTNWDTYYQLRTMAETPALQKEFMKINLLTKRGDLSNSHFKEFIDLQAGLHKQDDKTLKQLDGFRTDSQIVDDSWSALGKSKKDDPVEYVAYRRKIDDAIMAHQERTGKKATNKEVQEVVDNMLVEGITKRHPWYRPDERKRVYQLGDTEAVEIDAKDVPQAERSKIEAALKRRGIQATDKMVVEWYGRKRATEQNNGGQ